MVQAIEIELSINSDTTRSQIQINAYLTGHVKLYSMIQRLN